MLKTRDNHKSSPHILSSCTCFIRGQSARWLSKELLDWVHKSSLTFLHVLLKLVIRGPSSTTEVMSKKPSRFYNLCLSFRAWMAFKRRKQKVAQSYLNFLRFFINGLEKFGSLLALGEPNHRPCCIVDEKLRSTLSEMMYTINTLDMQVLSKENEKKNLKKRKDTLMMRIYFELHEYVFFFFFEKEKCIDRLITYQWKNIILFYILIVFIAIKKIKIQDKSNMNLPHQCFHNLKYEISI